ncbi:MAG: hypothetical protein HQM10_26920 [Candidatus Riflebacteria bacterium]|nr:hypothetical protein [Candidatus Riflebacteria bacterium]
MADKGSSKTNGKKIPVWADYKFDTSTYVILSSSVRREADTGRLVKVQKK